MTRLVADALTLLVAWSMILLLFVLAGCAPGPYVNYCEKPGNVQVSVTCERR